MVDYGTANKLNFIVHDGAQQDAVTANTYNDDAWHYVVGVADGSNLIIYIDDGAGQTGDAYDGGITYGAGSTFISVETPSTFVGIVDEARFSSTARTASWNKADYNSGNDSLLTYGSEETEVVTGNAIMFGNNF